MNRFRLQRIFAHFRLYTSGGVPPAKGAASPSAKSEEQRMMQQMHVVMQNDSQALRLHRELLLSIARGDAEGSGEVASLLAKRIAAGNRTPTMVHGDIVQNQKPSESENSSEPIPYSSSSLEDVTQKLSESLGKTEEAVAMGSASPSQNNLSPLTITIIDTNFEMEAADDLSGKADERSMKVLAQYLETDQGAWKAQKRAIAKAILDAAKECGISSELLMQSDLASGAGLSQSFNPFKECNILVRCEVPLASIDAKSAVEDQLAEMRCLPDWNEASEDIARRELEMSAVAMRYKVGLHYSIEAALGDARCRRFVSAAMRSLNEPHPSLSSELSIPTMPYTYMMRLCLWMEEQSLAEHDMKLSS